MKEVRGIKAYSIAAVLTNGCLVLLVLSAAIWQGAASTWSDLMIFIPAMSGSLLSVLYPLLLLILRRKYYQGRPIPSNARDLTHIIRIIQLLFTLILIFFSARGIINILQNRKYFQGRGLAVTSIFIFLAVTTVFNAVVFFKGWRLLKQTRKNYIDEVMAAFDDGEPSKQ